MTKNNPGRLCPECKKFDDQFTHGCTRLDILTRCDCDYDYPEISKENISNSEALEFFRHIILKTEQKNDQNRRREKTS